MRVRAVVKALGLLQCIPQTRLCDVCFVGYEGELRTVAKTCNYPVQA